MDKNPCAGVERRFRNEKILLSFPQTQRRVFFEALKRIQPFGKRAIEIRGTILPRFSPHYLVFLAGRDRRQNKEGTDIYSGNDCRRWETRLAKRFLLGYTVLPMFIFFFLLFPLFLIKDYVLHIAPEKPHVWHIVFFWSNSDGYGMDSLITALCIAVATCCLLLLLVLILKSFQYAGEQEMAEKGQQRQKAFAEKVIHQAKIKSGGNPVTETQLSMAGKAIINSQPFTNHTFDLRGRVPCFSSFFFVLLIGKERRQKSRHTSSQRAEEQNRLARFFFSFLVALPFLLATFFLCIYFIKAGIGISLFPLGMRMLRLSQADYLYFILTGLLILFFICFYSKRINNYGGEKLF